MSSRLRQQLVENPFLILELPPQATAQDVERAAQKLTSMLELKLSEAATYPTPLGRLPRTVEGVRAALAELRDPARRLFHELIAEAASAEVTAAPESPRWEEALSALGLGARR
jgi:hypothetical protein